MRQKSPKAVMTFSATADALAVEAAAGHEGFPGRMIPVPASINAGCGYAWRCELGERESLLAAIAKLGLAYEGIFEVDMY